MRIKSVILLFLAFLPARLSSESLVEFARLRIALGSANDEVGVLAGDGERWAPLFFAVDENGLVYIPDFYKARIAAFDAQGRYVRALPCPSGLSPRMNFFARSADGAFVVFDSSVLSCLNSDGSTRWRRSLGTGVRPEGVFVVETRIESIGLASNPSVCLVFPRRLDPNGGIVAFPLSGGGSFVRIDARSSDFAALPETDGRLMPEDESRAFRLISLSTDGTAYYSSREENRERIIRISPTEEGYDSATLSRSSSSGIGFWTFVDPNGNLWRNTITSEAIEIIRYRWE